MNSIWALLILAGLITYAIRLSFILLIGRVSLPQPLVRALRFVPPAVLSAIVLPELLVRNGSLALSPSNPRLLAGLIAAVVAWKTRSIVITIGVGMLALWALQALLGG